MPLLLVDKSSILIRDLRDMKAARTISGKV